MNKEINDPRKGPGPKGANTKRPKETAGREGGDDSLASTSPTDTRADEKVIVNEQREHKIVNAPSQTAVNADLNVSGEEEIVNGGA